MMEMVRRLSCVGGFVVSASVLSLGCGGGGGAQPAASPASGASEAAPGQVSELERYLPLADATVYTYDTTSEGAAAKGTLIVQISRPRIGRADLRMGDKTERLELQPGAITYVEGGFLLKAPIAEGQSWKGRSGVVRVVSVKEHVVVPAGTYDDCLHTVEETSTGVASRAVHSVYCPHVGLVSIDVQGASNEGTVRETAVLKAFGPRVDVGSGETTTVTTVRDSP